MDSGKIIIDLPELQRQKKRSLINSGKYCLAEVIVGKDDDFPLAHIGVEKVGQKEVARLIKTMQILIKELSKRDPVAYIMAQNINVKSGSVVTEYDEENKRRKDQE